MSSKDTILLLNPPANDIVIRDNYCSKISQAAYINHPIDLLIQSGYLKQVFNIKLIDCIAQKISPGRCLYQIRQIDPCGVFALTGNASWNQDNDFFKSLKTAMPEIKLVVSGDIFLEDPASFLDQYPQYDAILCDYTSPALSLYFQGVTSELAEMIYRSDSGIRDDRKPKPHGQILNIPLPRHELFCHFDYRYPFVPRKPFATVMTEYGCPFHCSFCVMGTLGHKLRAVDDIIDEIGFIRELGIRDIFFSDQSFGSVRKRNEEICEVLINRFPGIRWVCFSRVDLLDEPLLAKMKAAGCHTVILGVESAGQVILDRYRKGYTLERIIEVFGILRKLKIRSVATFLLGLPGETWESACATIDFAKELDCDFASINIAVPRMGTDLRKTAIKEGYIDPNQNQFDQSGSEVVMETGLLTRNQLATLKRKAVREIYFRPRYILRRLLSLRSFSEFCIQSREAYHLLRKFGSRPQ
jgi:anaerobic magnesium-protoporphyrin IX monomethyl ester cyclase